MTSPVTVIGAGLSGSQCSLALSRFGIPVRLIEQKPGRRSPAHQLNGFAELVCSNSLKSQDPLKAHGMLKAELRLLGSELLEIADQVAVPGGSALAVDRERFSEVVSETIRANPRIEVAHQEATDLPQSGLVAIATGPLSSNSFAQRLQTFLGDETLYFYDATSPIVHESSLDLSRLFFGNRYHEDEKDYLNIPLSMTEYAQFYEALTSGETHPAKDFEDLHLFSGCQPIEDIARQGFDTLRFGSFRPTGFRRIQGLEVPYAVIQMRRERIGNELWNLVGCQTRLTHPEQKRIFRTLPGFERAEFARLGMVHRNTFINSPRHLSETLQLKRENRIFVAGALTGAEGYTEAIATGLAAAYFISEFLRTGTATPLPAESCVGSLIQFISHSDPNSFQPMNVNRGLLPKLSGRPNPTAQADRSRRSIQRYLELRDSSF